MQNVSIYDENGAQIASSDGEYDSNKAIYQEFYEFNQDERGESYQAGVFYAYEAYSPSLLAICAPFSSYIETFAPSLPNTGFFTYFLPFSGSFEVSSKSG